MKISVIIPFYNIENYVDRCLASVTAQTYTDIEIIAVDDFSTDGTKDKILQWAQKDTRIKPVFHRQNGGLSAARNTGIDRAEGEYLVFVDGDDCVSADFVQTLYNMVCQNGTKLAVCGYSVNDEITAPDNSIATTQHYHTEVIGQRDYFLRMNSSLEIIYIVAWNKIYHRSIFENLRYANQINEDEEIIHKIIQNQEKIAVCYQPLYYYTVREGSIMKSSFKEKNMAALTAFDARKEYFQKTRQFDLAFMTMKNYMVKCLELYSMIDSSTENGEHFKKQIMQKFNDMLSQMKKSPVSSKKFILKMMYYKTFPHKYSPDNRTEILFG